MNGPDPRVVRVAFVVKSRSRKGAYHDVALMVGESGQRDFWDCTCEHSTLGGEECAHVRACRRLLARPRVESVANAAGSVT